MLGAVSKEAVQIMPLSQGFLLRVFMAVSVTVAAVLFCGAVFAPSPVPASISMTSPSPESVPLMRQTMVSPGANLVVSKQPVAFRHLNEMLFAERAVSTSV